MNVLDATVRGDRAMIDGNEIPLGADYGQPKGRVQIGVRPEFTHLGSGNDGLEVKLIRVEDVGRHKIARTEFFGRPINVIAGEGTEIGTDMTRVSFDPGHINVYENDWRLAPLGEAA
jgi:glycerol transport system ATP-binding protein